MDWRYLPTRAEASKRLPTATVLAKLTDGRGLPIWHYRNPNPSKWPEGWTR
jgi:hypothetical protein